MYYRFGPYRLYLPALLLFRGEIPVRLTPKALETLFVLVRNQGRMVSKQELLREVWSSTFVDEGTLAHNVYEIRKALSDHGSDVPYCIETISKKGYRFSAEVESCEEPPPVMSLAVLPFRGIGLAAHEDWLRIGLADAIITRLANLRNLAVRPTSAVAKYAGQECDSCEAGKQLAATKVVEGVLQNSGGQFRLTLQLVDVDSRRAVWGGQFDECAADLPSLENRAAQEVVVALPVRVNEGDWKSVSKRHTEDLQAYQLRLRARSMFYQPTPARLCDSITLLRQAIQRDPNYALAYSDLAYAYQFLAMFAFERPSEVLPSARSAAEKALRLDSTLAEARAALAFAQWHYDYEWAEAARQYRTLLDNVPNDARMHLQYGMLLGETGNVATSLIQFQKALELDPSFALLHASKAVVQCHARRFDEAIKSCMTALRIDPECFRAHWMLGVAKVQKDQYRAAIQHFRHAAEIADNHPPALAGLVHAYARAGLRETAAKALHQLEQISKQRYVPSDEMAVAYAGMGEINLAFKALFAAIEERSVHLVLAKGDPQFDALRPDPRFGEVLRRIGLA